MIQAIRKIGVPLEKSSMEDQVEALIVPVQSGEENRIVVMDFDLHYGQIRFELFPLTEEAVKKYFYIGTADGPASLQWMLTGIKPDYIISQSIPSLIKIIPHGEMKELLVQVLNTFYYDYGKQEKNKERYRYVLNVEKYLGLSTMNQLLTDSEGDIKKTVSEAAKAVTGYVTKKWEVKTKNISLWTVTINGEIIQQRKEYQELAWRLKEAHFENAAKGICYLCNKKEPVSSDTGKLKMNYYITQKVNFASYLKDFDKNMRLCKTCHRQLILGEIYAMRRFKGSIGKLKFLMLPELLFDEDTMRWKIEDIHNAYLHAHTIIDYKQAQKINRDYLKQMKRDMTNQYTFHFLFYMKQQLEFRVLRLIKDVAPSRIYAIQRAILNGKLFGEKWFEWDEGDTKKWMMAFEQIYYLFPIHEGDRDTIEHRRLLKLYDAIFTGELIDKKMVIEKLVQLAKVYHLEQTDSFQLKKPQDKEYAMIGGVLKGIVLLRYLEELSVLKGGEAMDTSILRIGAGYKAFIEEVGYNEQQAAMILLGKLIYEIGEAQKENRLTSKPILNKINFQGMTLNKIQLLTLSVFEKLKQYKLMTNEKTGYFIEAVYSDFKMLFDRNQDKWQLSPQENVFYILSGYALGSRPINQRKQEGEKENDKQQ
ncbi:TIGR02556 family CRISPR-associated protein [Thermotalea metallivorans]|uniref:CRISPR-associated protein n=1 Tax=Thermotalea metallivorans TaxID=520762 RepID=A0A140L1D8_9FIRM|nr:TIGR02556 family CRISPR-associated protein [Thermotalea metallivorans]KXG74363.1 hypothetical protein AN619_24140 [Thermotalea metallivorans]